MSQPKNSSKLTFLEKIAQQIPKVNQLYFWSETRTQILLCYIGLMTLLIGGSIPVVYQTLFREVDRYAEAEVLEEIQEFRRLVVTLPPQDIPALQQQIERYLQTDSVDSHQYSILIFKGEYVQSNPVELPAVMQPGSRLMNLWRSFNSPRQGTLEVADAAVGKVIYWAEPIYGNAQVQGMFIVAYSTANERAEMGRLIGVVQGTMLWLLGLASILAWFITGKILEPMREVAETARGISESDLSQRISVKGKGELAEMAQTFNDMMDRLQVAFQSQQEFINDASHELRTPITIIQGHLDLMGDDPEEQAEVLSLVNGELNRMNRFVTDLLLLAKAGRPDFVQFQAIQIDAFTEEIFNKARVIVECDCQMDAQGQGEMITDPQRLTQAILNLVENANQHTPSHGLIAVGSSRSRKHIRFWVRDTGIGIAPEDQQRIFERFARATDTVRRSEGAGLGLAIVQAIVKELNGRVEVKSILGRGATFTLVFPSRNRKNHPSKHLPFRQR
jgi:signal transduction histidine kinase